MDTPEKDNASRPLFAVYSSVSKNDEDTYVSKFPHACLVYPNKTQYQASDLYATTTVVSPVMLKKASGTDAEKAGFEIAVSLLKKTPRNPFASHIYVGRASNNDIVILDDSISKAHAFFEQIGDSWFVTDVESKNGTMVDGEKLTPRKAVKIADGQQVSLGTVVVRLFSPRAFHRHVLGLFKKTPSA